MKRVTLLLMLPVLASCARPEQVFVDIAGSYQGWGKVDDEARWAPELCRQPNPSVLRASASTDEATHGRKLYYLFAKDRAGYVKRSSQPDGQVLVKEAWTPGGQAAGLYIMAKTGGSESDAGWVYGTVSPEGTVTSSGRVASCMKCHVDAPADRLFGLKSP